MLVCETVLRKGNKLWLVQQRHITDVIEASSYSAPHQVKLGVSSLYHRNFEDEPLVFNFTTGTTPDWNQPGMVAGVLLKNTNSSLQNRVTFILKEGGNEVPLHTFVARCRDEQKHWARRAGCKEGSAWEAIIKRLMRRAQSGMPREINLMTRCFQESRTYDMC